MREDAAVTGRRRCFEPQAACLNLVEQRRRRHEPVVLQVEGRQGDAMTREAKQILKPRARRRHPLRLRGPAELREERLRIKDVPAGAFWPIPLHQANDAHLVDVGERCCRRIHQRHAVAAQSWRERLTLNPATKDAGQIGW